jgi:hypothetical protein
MTSSVDSVIFLVSVMYLVVVDVEDHSVVLTYVMISKFRLTMQLLVRKRRCKFREMKPASTATVQVPPLALSLKLALSAKDEDKFTINKVF